MSSPSSNSSRLLKKISIISSKPRAFRVAVLGQNGVGKTALVVRFVTRRFIGDYDPFLEKVYTCQRIINGGPVDFEILDTAGLNENSKLKEHIRWADAIVLMYDVTDRCSFNECSRLKFLVNAHSRRSGRKAGSDPDKELAVGIPVVLVANKRDKHRDRMVQEDEGATRSTQLNCVNFTEVSVREDIDDIMEIFDSLYIFCRRQRKMRFLSPSKNSLVPPDKLESSSEEDWIENGGDHGEGKGSARNRRRETLTSTPDLTSHNDMIKRAKSRRREALYAVS